MVTVEQGKTFEIGKVFERVAETLGAHGGLYLIMTALFVGIPAFMMQWWLVQNNVGGDPRTLYLVFGTSEFVVPWLIILLVSFITDAALQGGLIHATGRSLSGRPVGVTDCLEVGFTRLVPVFVLNILIGLGCTIASFLLIVPGIILAVCWSVAVAVNVEERNGIGGALDRSMALTRGSRWNIFFLFLILIVGVFIGGYVIKLVAGVAGFRSVPVLSVLTDTVVQVVSRVAWITIGACLYFELRRLKEGAPRDELETVFS